jgi:hypothetical protein
MGIPLHECGKGKKRVNHICKTLIKPSSLSMSTCNMKTSKYEMIPQELMLNETISIKSTTDNHQDTHPPNTTCLGRVFKLVQFLIQYEG